MAGSDGIPTDPYELLGIERDATPEDVKKAFRRESRRWHPDRAEGSRRRFEALVAARDRLLVGKPEPYFIPKRIDWLSEADGPELLPATISLCNRGADGKEVILGRDAGDFWAIDELRAVGEDGVLYELVIRPTASDALAVGQHEDMLMVDFDGEVAELPIALLKSPPRAPTPGRSARGSPRGAAGGVSPPPSSGTRGSTAPAPARPASTLTSTRMPPKPPWGGFIEFDELSSAPLIGAAVFVCSWLVLMLGSYFLALGLTGVLPVTMDEIDKCCGDTIMSTNLKVAIGLGVVGLTGLMPWGIVMWLWYGLRLGWYHLRR